MQKINIDSNGYFNTEIKAHTIEFTDYEAKKLQREKFNIDYKTKDLQFDNFNLNIDRFDETYRFTTKGDKNNE